MKEETFKYIKSFVCDENNVVSGNQQSRCLARKGRKNCLALIFDFFKNPIFAKNLFYTLISLLFGIIPICVIPLWRLMSVGSNFDFFLIDDPNLIVVSIALWISFICSSTASILKTNRFTLVLNIISVAIGFIMFTLEVIFKESGGNIAKKPFLIWFNIIFCICFTLLKAISETISINMENGGN